MNAQIKALADRLTGLPWHGTGLPAALRPYLAPAARYRADGGGPRVAFELLAAAGLSGWAVRYDLVAAVNYYRQRDQNHHGTYIRAYRRLTAQGLWESYPATFAQRRVILVRLTDLGRTLLAEAGVPSVPSEWDIIEAKHRGAANFSQMGHTAAICLFLHHARLRGYATVACPTGDVGPAEPDALIAYPTISDNTQGAQRSYVEVQGRGGSRYQKAHKWHNQAVLQGYSAICAETPGWAARLAAEAQQGARIARGVVTDLTTLVTGAPANLWTHRWRSEYMPLEPVTEPDGTPLFTDER